MDSSIDTRLNTGSFGIDHVLVKTQPSDQDSDSSRQEWTVVAEIPVPSASYEDLGMPILPKIEMDDQRYVDNGISSISTRNAAGNSVGITDFIQPRSEGHSDIPNDDCVIISNNSDEEEITYNKDLKIKHNPNTTSRSKASICVKETCHAPAGQSVFADGHVHDNDNTSIVAVVEGLNRTAERMCTNRRDLHDTTSTFQVERKVISKGGNNEGSIQKSPDDIEVLEDEDSLDGEMNKCGQNRHITNSESFLSQMRFFGGRTWARGRGRGRGHNRQKDVTNIALKLFETNSTEDAEAEQGISDEEAADDTSKGDSVPAEPSPDHCSQENKNGERTSLHDVQKSDKYPKRQPRQSQQQQKEVPQEDKSVSSREKGGDQGERKTSAVRGRGKDAGVKEGYAARGKGRDTGMRGGGKRRAKGKSRSKTIGNANEIENDGAYESGDDEETLAAIRASLEEMRKGNRSKVRNESKTEKNADKGVKNMNNKMKRSASFDISTQTDSSREKNSLGDSSVMSVGDFVQSDKKTPFVKLRTLSRAKDAHLASGSKRKRSISGDNLSLRPAKLLDRTETVDPMPSSLHSAGLGHQTDNVSLDVTSLLGTAESTESGQEKSFTKTVGGMVSCLFGENMKEQCPSGFVVNVRLEVEKKKDTDIKTESPIPCCKRSDPEMCPCLKRIDEQKLAALLKKKVEERRDLTVKSKGSLLASILQIMHELETVSCTT